VVVVRDELRDEVEVVEWMAETKECAKTRQLIPVTDGIG
jgi:hypothetical protein